MRDSLAMKTSSPAVIAATAPGSGRRRSIRASCGRNSPASPKAPDSRRANSGGAANSQQDQRQGIRRKVMRFGLFGSAQARRAGPDTDSSQGFRDFIDNNVEAEALGYYSTFLVEHHFTGFGQVSASLNLLTWLGARTRNLRLGTAVLVLPWHNPVLLAEQAATLDLLSGGRLDFGIGKGYRYNEFAGFCMPMEEADARFDEALTVILQAWTADEPFSHRGKYWQFHNILVEPPTAQRPHPPIWMGAGGENSIRRVAAQGFNLLLGQYASPKDVAWNIAVYKAEVEARGRRFDPMQIGVTRAFFVAENAAEREAAMDRRLKNR